MAMLTFEGIKHEPSPKDLAALEWLHQLWAVLKYVLGKLPIDKNCSALKSNNIFHGSKLAKL